MPKNQPSWWSSARVEELKARWHDGETASAICAAMAAPSRNAVIGKANRIGLFYKAKKPAPARPRTRKARKQVMAKTYATMSDADMPPAFENPKPFIALGRDDCHWPGAGRGPDMQCCAAPVAVGHPYCARHCRIAYTHAPRPSVSK
jgi:GcrA cell cycle regulator